jgi:hypothetical protein
VSWWLWLVWWLLVLAALYVAMGFVALSLWLAGLT